MKYIFIGFLLSVTSCQNVDLAQVMDVATSQLGAATGEPSSAELKTGLRAALLEGIQSSVFNVSKTNGYLANQLITIALPPEARKAASVLQKLGLGSLVDKTQTSLNRAAEQAADKALPIFQNAIQSLTIEDALALLTGPKDGATSYLKSKTSQDLSALFRPSIQNSLSRVGATKYWSDMTTQYNQIPFVKPMNADLAGYVTQNALEGLFKMVAQKELQIRNNPLGAASSVAQRVFSYAKSL